MKVLAGITIIVLALEILVLYAVVSDFTWSQKSRPVSSMMAQEYHSFSILFDENGELSPCQHQRLHHNLKEIK